MYLESEQKFKQTPHPPKKRTKNQDIFLEILSVYSLQNSHVVKVIKNVI